MTKFRYSCNICDKVYPSSEEAEECYDKHFVPRCCTFCGKDVTFFEDFGYDNATEFVIEPGYSSTHDGETSECIICDNCFSQFKNKMKAKYSSLLAFRDETKRVIDLIEKNSINMPLDVQKEVLKNPEKFV